MNEKRAVDVRLFLVVCLYFLIACWGVLQVVIPNNGALYFLVALAVASCATVWAVADSRRNGHRLIHIIQFLMFITWPIALPIYLIWSRRLRGFGLAVLHAFGLMITLCVFFYGTIIILYGPDAFIAE